MTLAILLGCGPARSVMSHLPNGTSQCDERSLHDAALAQRADGLEEPLEAFFVLFVPHAACAPPLVMIATCAVQTSTINCGNDSLLSIGAALVSSFRRSTTFSTAVGEMCVRGRCPESTGRAPLRRRSPCAAPGFPFGSARCGWDHADGKPLSAARPRRARGYPRPPSE